MLTVVVQANENKVNVIDYHHPDVDLCLRVNHFVGDGHD
jgi:hypothetical protein